MPGSLVSCGTQGNHLRRAIERGVGHILDAPSPGLQLPPEKGVLQGEGRDVSRHFELQPLGQAHRVALGLHDWPRTV